MLALSPLHDMAALRQPLSNISTPRQPSASPLRPETPPLLPPKDEDGPLQSPKRDIDSYFYPMGMSRTSSIYTISKTSFARQLQDLTSINLPDASSLSESISALPTAVAATRALSSSAQQIQRWIQKANEVLGGLDAEDDVDWAAAAGKDGIPEVEAAIEKFEHLVTIYVETIEKVRGRDDIHTVPRTEYDFLLGTMEQVIHAWDGVRTSLKEVKRQADLALEWEELWNHVLGDIGAELSSLTKLVFEMEEKRHRIGIEDSSADLSMQELETIVEEAPEATANKVKNRFSLPPAYPSGGSPLQSPGIGYGPSTEDSSLLALFARMQPLRASLDFVPMRLDAFEIRAKPVLPSACSELQERKGSLENKWKQLEEDAELLRKELGEDRWVIVFRNAGRQAQKMAESIERGIVKLCEAIENGAHHNNPTGLAKKIGDYEAKKNNYGPAIQKVLTVIDRGVKDRLTINGEILQIQQDTRSLWNSLERSIKEMDGTVEDLNLNKSQQLRDSISTIVSNDISNTGSNRGTPGTSPSSSVIMGTASAKKSMQPKTPDLVNANRRSSIQSATSTRPNISRRNITLPAGQLNKRTSVSQSPLNRIASTSSSPGGRTVSGSSTPTASRRGTPLSVDYRPRWNAGTKVEYGDIAHNYKPFTPSARSKAILGDRQSSYSYRTPRSVSSSVLPSPSPLGRASTASPMPPPRAPTSRASSSLATRSVSRGRTSPSPARVVEMGSDNRPKSRLYTPGGTGSAQRMPSTRRTSQLPLPRLNSGVGGEEDEEKDEVPALESPTFRPKMAPRPATSMALSSTNRRISSLPSRTADKKDAPTKWRF